MKDRKHSIKFTLIIAALVILANPFYSLFDILPDFIGYAILFSVLLDISDIYPHFDEAKENFRKLMWINVSKIPFLILMNWVRQQHANESTLLSVIVFVYMIAELIFLIPGIARLFDGLRYVGERENLDDVLRAGKRISLNKVFVFSMVFFIFRSVLSFLPELLFVPVSESRGHYLQNYRETALLCCCALVMLLGIIWLFITIKYVLRLKNSAGLSMIIKIKTEEVGTALCTKKKIRGLYLILNLVAVCVGFNIDLIFDNVNILPDTVSAILFIFVCFTARKQANTKEFRTLLSLGFLYAIVSVISYSVNTSFLYEFDYSAIAKTDAAESAYLKVIILSALEEITFIILMIFFTKFIYKMIKKNTGYEYNDRLTRDIHEKEKRKSIVFFVFAVLSSISSFMYTFLMSFTKTVDADAAYVPGGKLVIPMFDGYWLLPIAISILWLVYTMTFFDYVKGEISHKFDE